MTDMDSKITCPNCDDRIDSPVAEGQFDCPNCGAVLEVTGGRPSVIAHATEALRGEEREGLPGAD